MADLWRFFFFSWYILDSSVVGTAAYEFKMNFDVVLKNIRELNILAGEGCSEVSRTKDGARLKVHVVHSLLFTVTQSSLCPLAHKAINFAVQISSIFLGGRIKNKPIQENLGKKCLL